MQVPFTFSLIASVLVVAAELQAAEPQRLRPTTITVVASEGLTEPMPATALVQASIARTQKAADQAKPRRNSVQFLLPDRSMSAWIEPAGTATTAAIADREPRVSSAASSARSGTSRVVTVRAVEHADNSRLAPTSPVARQPASRLTAKLIPAAPPLPEPHASTHRVLAAEPAFLGELPTPAAASTVRF